MMCMYGVEPECGDGYPLQTPSVEKLLDIPRMPCMYGSVTISLLL